MGATSSYFDLFMGESQELLSGLNHNAVELERDPSNAEILDAIFRAFHTLKGMAGMMEYKHFAAFLHDAEAMLDGLRKGAVAFSADIGVLLFASIDAAALAVAAIGRKEEDRPIDAGLRERLAAVVHAMPVAVAQSPSPEPSMDRRVSARHGAERRTNLRLEDADRERIFAEATNGIIPYEVIVRLTDACAMPRARMAVVVNALKECGTVIREEYLDRQLTGRSFGRYVGLFFLSDRSSDDLSALVCTIPEVQDIEVRRMDLESLPRKGECDRDAVAPAATSEPRPGAAESHGSMRVEIGRLSHLMDVTGELLLARQGVDDMATKDNRKGLRDALSRLAKLMSGLQHDVLDLQLIPIDSLFGRYPRLVRDVAAKLGKRVHLSLAGGEIGLDKRALDALNDPLLHLIRNAVSHGIESPGERQDNGKNAEGIIRIEAVRDRESIIVTISDDGRGIDPAIAGPDRPPDGTPELFAALLDVISRPGFSTVAATDDISGRGVGMEVVRTGIAAIGGTLSLSTIPGRGTTFQLSVPLTLSIIHSLQFEIGGIPYAIPLSQIREIVHFQRQDLHRVEQFLIFEHHGRVIPLIDFPFDPESIPSGLRGDPGGAAETATEGEGEVTALVIDACSKPVALRIDRLGSQLETIVKPLPPLLKKVPGLAGATILGNGRVAFVLDMAGAIA